MELNGPSAAPVPRPANPKGGRHRTRSQREQDQEDIARLSLEGKSYREIVAWIAANRPYTLSKAMVSQIMAKVTAGWRERATEHIDAAKSRDLAQLDAVQRKAQEAYDRSLQEHERTHQEQVTKGSGAGATVHAKAVVVREKRDGDPRFLEIIQRCIEQRARILGYNAPVKVQGEITTPPGQPLQVEGSTTVRLPQLAPEQLADLLGKIGAAQDAREARPATPAEPTPPQEGKVYP